MTPNLKRLVHEMVTATVLGAGCCHAYADQLTFPNLRPSDSLSITMACEDHAAKKTKTIVGPSGVLVSLIIQSHDDYNKYSHDCEAGYIVEVSPGPKLKGPYDGFFGSDAAWDRHLSARVVGFSGDGKWLVGFLGEDGEYPVSEVFSYNIATNAHFGASILPKRPQSRLAPACFPMSILGTTADGLPVVSADMEGSRGGANRWVADPTTGFLKPLPKGDVVSGLYKGDAR